VKIRAFVAVRDPVVRRTLVTALKRDRDIVLVPEPEEADVVVGCRVRREGYNSLMQFNSWLYPKIVRALFGLQLRDFNWISVYRLDLARRVTITQSGVPMLVEILVKLRDLGATFREVDCRMQPRRTGKASASRFSVMYRTFTGLMRLWCFGYFPARRRHNPPHVGAR